MTTAANSRVFRFSDVEVRERQHRVTRAGKPLAIEPKAVRVLLYLLENAGHVVTKEELLSAVWGDTAVTDNSLTRAVALIRRVLEDDPHMPAFIETVSTAGYRFICPVAVEDEFSETPVATGTSVNGAEALLLAVSPIVDSDAQAKVSGTKRRLWATAGVATILLAFIAVAIWYLRRPLPPLRILDFVQITHDGRIKFLKGTDGSRLYFNLQGNPPIAQVAIGGGEIAPFPVPLPGPRLADVSPDGTSFLVGSEEKGQQGLWGVQIPGGSVRLLANGVTFSAAWSPDGKSIVYRSSDGDIFVVRSDGTDARKLATAASWAIDPLVWSPDGGAIRFIRDDRLWEMSSDGTGLHQLLPGWHPASRLCCGRWTPDGKFFLFAVQGNLRMNSFTGFLGGQLWALDERHMLLRRQVSEPIPLTSGPIQWASPIAGRGRNRIFARGVMLRGEMVRYDARSRELKPWFEGMSIEGLSYSPDRKSIVYVSFPEGILWRANWDGTNPVQLTSPPLYPINPRWSPDGSNILFASSLGGVIIRGFMVSAQGGTPQPILPDDREGQNDPNWSPDGHKIIFGAGKAQRWNPAVQVRILDLTTHQIATYPGSQGIWSPRWSPNGRLIAGINSTGGISVFDSNSQQWSELQKGQCNYPTWSSDSQFVYFMRVTSDDPGVYRVRVSDRHVELVVDLKGFHHTGAVGFWMGLDPTDTPMLFRNTGSDDIYALTLEEK